MGEKKVCEQEYIDKINELKSILEKTLKKNAQLKLELNSLYGSQNEKKLNEMSCEELHEKAGEIEHELCIRGEQNRLKLAKINIMKYYRDATDEYMIELDQIGNSFPDIIFSLDQLIITKNELDTSKCDLVNENKYLREKIALLEQVCGIVNNDTTYPVLDVNETLKLQRKVNADNIKYGKYKIGR